MLTNKEIDFKKYFVEHPTDFSPERNKEVVKKSIEDYEIKRKFNSDKFTDQLKERVHAAASYILHTNGLHKSTSVENYFTRSYLAHLQGQRIVQRIKRLKNGQQIITLEEVS